MIKNALHLCHFGALSNRFVPSNVFTSQTRVIQNIKNFGIISHFSLNISVNLDLVEFANQDMIKVVKVSEAEQSDIEFGSE